MKRGLKSIHTNRHDALRMASARMFEQISSITYFFALQGKHEDVRTNIKHLLPYFLSFKVVAPMQSSMFCNTREVQRNIMWHFSLVCALPALKGKKQVMLDVLVSCLI